MASSGWAEVHELALSVSTRAPGAAPPSGASDAALLELERRLGAQVHPDLRTWLSLVNGDAISEGGVFGNVPERPSLDIPTVASVYDEQWRPRGWVPVAGDGCGNYYVITPAGTVEFVDTHEDPACSARVVAPSLVEFLAWYLPRR